MPAKRIARLKYGESLLDIDVVTSIAQTTVDNLNLNGEFTKEKQEKVFNQEKSDIMEILSEDVKVVLTEI